MVRTVIVIIFLVLFGISSLIALPVLALVGKVSPAKKLSMSTAYIRGALKIILFLTGVKYTVIGRENIPSDRPVLYAINHRGFFDLVLAVAVIPGNVGCVAKKELAKPGVAIWMKNIKCVFLDRQNPREGIKAIMEAIENVKNGTSMLIAPEGTRNHGAGVQEFKPGSLKIAEKTGCPIIPVAITGSDDVLENHFPKLKAVPMTIEFGEPVDVAGMTKEDKKNLLTMVHDRVLTMYEKNNK